VKAPRAFHTSWFCSLLPVVLNTGHQWCVQLRMPSMIRKILGSQLAEYNLGTLVSGRSGLVSQSCACSQ